MTTVLVTGSSGFVGRHLIEALGRRGGLTVRAFDVANTDAELTGFLGEADIIYHLAGVNRPQSEAEFETGNAGLTRDILTRLRELGRTPIVVLSSSVQVLLDNAYGRSKLRAESEVQRYAAETGAAATVFRLKNVFGKWCRPNYNSVVATFCHNIANNLPISISDPAREIDLVYIDDVIAAFLSVLDLQSRSGTCEYREVARSYPIALGALAEMIGSFRDSRHDITLPSFTDRFTRCLYATYLSYLGEQDFAYQLDIKADNRGELAEFIKSPSFGQIFVSRTKPGITRGNHYHHTKTEKFFVVEGEAIVRFRPIESAEVIEYRVSGRDFRVVDIPPGYTHSIENVGDSTLVVLFWASEVFDPTNPETYYAEVLNG